MRLYGTSTGDGVIRISPVQNYRKEVMTEELKIGEIPSDEGSNYDTDTEVEEIK